MKSWKDKQRTEAIRMFGVVNNLHENREFEFNCRLLTEQSGWLNLAAESLRLKEDRMKFKRMADEPQGWH